MTPHSGRPLRHGTTDITHNRKLWTLRDFVILFPIFCAYTPKVCLMSMNIIKLLNIPDFKTLIFKCSSNVWQAQFLDTRLTITSIAGPSPPDSCLINSGLTAGTKIWRVFLRTPCPANQNPWPSYTQDSGLVNQKNFLTWLEAGLHSRGTIIQKIRVDACCLEFD